MFQEVWDEPERTEAKSVVRSAIASPIKYNFYSIPHIPQPKNLLLIKAIGISRPLINVGKKSKICKNVIFT